MRSPGKGTSLSGCPALEGSLVGSRAPHVQLGSRNCSMGLPGRTSPETIGVSSVLRLREDQGLSTQHGTCFPPVSPGFAWEVPAAVPTPHACPLWSQTATLSAHRGQALRDGALAEVSWQNLDGEPRTCRSSDATARGTHRRLQHLTVLQWSWVLPQAPEGFPLPP